MTEECLADCRDTLLRIATALEALAGKVAALVPTPTQAATQATPAAKPRKPRAKSSDSDSATVSVETPAPDDFEKPDTKISEKALRTRLIEQVIERLRAAQDAGVSEDIIAETLASGLGSGATVDDAPVTELFNLSLALQRLTTMSQPNTVEEPAEAKRLKEATLGKMRETIGEIVYAGRLAEAITLLTAYTGTAGSVDSLATEQLTALLAGLQELTVP